jgi:hypothetical protein
VANLAGHLFPIETEESAVSRGDNGEQQRRLPRHARKGREGEEAVSHCGDGATIEHREGGLRRGSSRRTAKQRGGVDDDRGVEEPGRG